jgi:GT2 family glycosyltransferase
MLRRKVFVIEPRATPKTQDRQAASIAGCVQLELPLPAGVPDGSWLHIRYRMALCRSAARPLIRFEAAGEQFQAAMGAALFGTAEWVGPAPDQTRQARIVLPPGMPATGFSFVSCKALSFRQTLVLAGRRSILRTAAAAGLMLLGRTEDAIGLLDEILNATPLSRYHEWRTASERSLEPEGVDGVDANCGEDLHIRAVVQVRRGGSPKLLSATLASLRRQSYRDWSLALVGEAAAPTGEPPAICIGTAESAERLWDGLEASDIVLPILAGDVLPDYAMATLAGFAVSCPATSLFYADEDALTAGGRYASPALKPDWSPIFHSARPYVGRAVYFRRRVLDGEVRMSAGDFMHMSTWDGLFARKRGPVGHIRRVLLTRAAEAQAGSNSEAIPPSLPQASSPATATIIVPTRDRADLLAVCLASLELTSPHDFELLIVDNGSKQSAALELIDRCRKRPGVRVLHAPGPFNFSSLCNRGAALAQGRVLVFLNNDTEVIRPDWLSCLVGWAVQPDVGAVGPKLLHSSGRVQHAGLVLSLGGYAAHVDVGAAPADEGYLGRLSAPHEVSAVTGACLVVEKSKFDAVDGFDGDKYPVELGDVDLCLRLAKRGWKCVFTPESFLIHRESASRGKAGRARRYAWERRHFMSDWGDVVADDPYFHPALSLAAPGTSLDR